MLATICRITPALPSVGATQYLIANKDSMFSVELSFGMIEMPGRWLLLNLVMWKPLVRRALPILEKHVRTSGFFTKDTIAEINNAILDDVREMLRMSDKSAEQQRAAVRSLKYEYLHGINELYNLTSTDLNPYIVSTSAVSIARTLMHPKMQAACTIDVEEEEKIGIHAVEKKIQKIYDRVLEVAVDRTIPGNAFFGNVALGILSRQQLVQVVCCAGTRTDVNDMMIGRALKGSYFRGLRDAREYNIDSLSGKKSAIYNAYGMPKSQYPKRKFELMASTLRYLYHTNCGADVYMPFEIHSENYKNVVGKVIFEGGMLKELASVAATKEYIGKEVLWRSPITCRHGDGVCAVCVGKLSENWDDTLVPGYHSVSAVMEPAGQLILSNKHLSQTNAVVYSIPAELKSVAFTIRDEIYFRRDASVDNVMIGVPFGSMRISDVAYIEEGTTFNDQNFSSVDSIIIANSETGELLAPEVFMGQIRDKASSRPYFTAEFLMYIKNNPDMISIGNVIWVNLRKYDRGKPVMRVIVANDSMIAFVTRVDSFFRSGLSRYGSARDALRDFSNGIYKKLNPNIVHIEIMLRSAMIRSQIDYGLPLVTDVDDVIFGKLDNVILSRSIGPALAFEKFIGYTANPMTFLVPRETNLLDTFVGLES